jgi:hypothetical protein
MRFGKPALLGLGGLMVLSGLLWMAQGTGYFPYPASSFMISQKPWILWGALMTGAGVVVILLSRKKS